MTKIQKIFLIIVLIGISFFIFLQKSEKGTEILPKDLKNETETSRILPESKEIEKSEEPKIEEIVIKEKVDLDVPFTSQAPFAYWDELHNEACEEAAIIMIDAFLKRKQLSSEIVDQEILKMVHWQKENWAGHFDLSVSKTADLAEKFFEYKKIRVIYDFILKNLKKEISKGNPVIVPMAGRKLNNPYFRQPGPVYHMLVVRGYNEKEIITNDPGTRRGEGFRYSYQNFLDSAHDWPYEFKKIIPKEEAALGILKGRRAMIVIEP